MRRIITFSFLASLFVLLLSMDVSSGGRAGHTGSPGEQTCAKSGCHDSNALNTGIGSVAINAVGLENNTYVPGQTYTIQVVVSYTSRNLFGMGFEALQSSGANAGTLTPGTGTQTMNFLVGANNRTNIVHTSNGGASPNSHTFSFTWVAPAASAGTVGFYAAGVCANGNGSDLGDFVYTTSRTLTPLVLPAAPTITAAGNTTICVGQSVTLSVNAEAGVSYSWRNANNVSVGTGTSFVASATGCYSVVATNAGGSVNSTNNICVTLSSPDAGFSGLPLSMCSNAASVNLSANSIGGTFSGTGVAGTSFNPASAGVGSHTVTYSVTDANNCTANTNRTVVVAAPLDASFGPLPMSFCSNESPVSLSPITANGSFTGPGITGTSFNPAVISPGAVLITYTVNNNGCVTTSSQNVVVRQAPNASWAIPWLNYCASETFVTLTPADQGGTFSGNGVSGSVFNPSAAGAGVHPITYTLTDAFNCSDEVTTNVTVNAPLDASFSGLQNVYCSNDSDAEIVTAVSGGNLSGTGLAGNVFSPAAVGSGVATITYSLSNGACFTTTSQQVTVRPAPNASFTGLLPFYCTTAEATTMLPTVAGGTFSGDGITGDVFDPAISGAGTFTVSYAVTSELNCTAVSTQSVTVASSANSDFTGFENGFCTAGPSATLEPVIAGGIFSGDIITAAGELLLAEAAPGTYTVVYTLSSGDCSSTTEHALVVNPLPNAAFANLESSYCFNDNPVQLSPAVSGGTFTVNGNLVDAFVPQLIGAGECTLTYSITDSNGCENSSSQSITIVANPDGTVTLSNGTLTAAQEGATYQWTECLFSQEISGATNASFTPTESGLYFVELGLNGCITNSACVDVVVIGVDELNSALRIYPNPAADELWLELRQTSQIMMCDAQGREVLRSNGTAGVNHIDVAHLEGGWYVVKVMSAHGMHSAPILVSH